MPEQYQVFFNSRASNAIQDPTLGLNKVTYLMNWEGFLPHKYKRFLCQFVFKSENYASAAGAVLTDNGLVNMQMGSLYSFNGDSRNNNIGIINPTITTYTSGGNCSSYYSSGNGDNNPFYMDFPVSQDVVITLNRFNNTAMANMQHYCLILNLVGVSDADDENDNR